MSSSEQHETVPRVVEDAVSPARSDKSSDSEGRPVREKFQKTSIDATANPMLGLGQTTSDAANGSLKPGSRGASGSDSERGRLRRKRSREDMDDDNEGEKQPDKKQERLEKTSEKPERHVRKRSRDLTKDLEGGALKPATTAVSRIEETDAEMASPNKDATSSTVTEGRVGTSPKNKRPRDDTEASGAVEDSTKDLPTNGQTATKASDERESKRARDKEEAKPAKSIPAGSGFANTSAASPFAAMSAKPAPPKTSEGKEALPQTSDDKFKASGFGSLASSSVSPFGGFGAASKAGSPFGGAPKLSSFASPATTSSLAAPPTTNGFFGSLDNTKSSFGGSSVFGGASSSPFGGSFASKPSGSGSFATPGATVITGLSSKPERAFGAPGDKTDDDKSDDEDDEDDPDKDPEEGGRPSQSLSGTAPTETGEEHETSAWVGRAKLYTMDGEGKERGWKERGVGNIKLNVTKDEPKKARFVLRADGTHRLILNAAVTKTLVFGADSEGAKPKDGRLLFNSPNAEGNLDMHLLKLKSERAVELWEEVAQVQKDEL
ncbi:hypothetical protein C7974DRAFT_92297 [Boeremia exigua]|uniref:uncharacterized protein n=1 Tax=Boeremia exigua TaxID=749465 RepID=UPI001E8E82F0|nr:uncharacterized protein C7974DRAFT_92297 [Boeremia exigua]KAH6612165.1 hypothetical protein C7974DRAFT_92297 [Boeremia exigua]